MEQMKEILKRIQNGETSFGPVDNSQEAIKAFQPIAKRIFSANERGYLVKAIFRHSTMRETSGDILQIAVIGGLTFEGEQFLLSKP